MTFFDDMSIRLSFFFPDLPLLLSLLPLLVIRRVTVLTWASEEGDDPRCIICLITRREDDHHFLERQRTTIGRYVIIQLRYFSLLSNKNICPLFSSPFFSYIYVMLFSWINHLPRDDVYNIHIYVFANAYSWREQK